MEDLDRFVKLPEAARQFAEAAQQALVALTEEAMYAVVDLPLTNIAEKKPETLGSIRIAAFWPGKEMGFERHGNSTQFLYSLDGTGETRVVRNGAWERDRYGAIEKGALEERWHVVREGIWHQSVATGARPWVMAALHSARKVQDEFIPPMKL